MLKKILGFLKYVLLIIAIAALGVGIVWTNIQATSDKCRHMFIDIVNTDSVAFVTKGSIINMLNSSGLNPEGLAISQINTDKIEQQLNSSEYIENTECVILENNNMHITVTQLIPVIRVFDGEESYYLNKNGKRMNASSRFHADVPIVSGNFVNHADALMIRPIAEYVQKDKALRDLITMYAVKDSNNIIVVPCIYGHVINFGNNQGIENKFAKLKKFYREVMPVKGWLTYDTITLKWYHQVVASRRTKKLKKEILYNPEEEEIAPPIESIMVQGLNDPATLGKDIPNIGSPTPQNDTIQKKQIITSEKTKDVVDNHKKEKPKANVTETVAKAFGKKKTN